MRIQFPHFGTTAGGVLASTLLWSIATLAQAETSIFGTPPTTVQANRYYGFQSWATDNDNRPIRYGIMNKPSWATFNEKYGHLYGVPTAANAGTYKGIVIYATDGVSNASLPAFNIQVTSTGTSGGGTTTPPTPTVTIKGTPATTVVQNTAYSFQASATDTSHRTISFSVVNKPSWAAFNSQSGTLSGTPTAANVGTYTSILIAATDGLATAALPAFSIQVTAPASTGGSTGGTPTGGGTTGGGTTGGGTSGGTGTGGPSAVSNLQLVNQGGPGNSTDSGKTGSLSNYQQISWAAATPGANPIVSYNIYRNGTLYANTTGLTYSDTKATNSNVTNWATPATIYSYNVAAVDSQGNVGPLAAQMSMYGYQHGKSNWSNGDLSYDGVQTDYASTGGNPQGGTYDISSVFAVGGGFLPTADAPQCPVWDCEIGAFNYFTIDINPGPIVSPYVQLITQARLPPGDDGSWANGLNIFAYGPAPKANTWATYKVPLKALHFGVSSFTGSISGSKLTVTAVSSQGMGAVDADGYVTGPGVPAGTYVTAYGQTGSIGTFTVAGPGINSGTSVPSETMTFQRTNLYKFGLQPNTDPVTMYWNNFGFTVN